MTVASGARSSTSGDGSTTEFTATFRANSQSEIGVALVNDTTKAVTVQTITTHYTVSFASGTAGVPTITFVSAPASGNTVLIYPTNTVKQEDDLDPSSNLYGSTIEATVDKLAAQLQTLEDQIKGCIRVAQADESLSAVGDGDTRENTVVTFGANGALVLRANADFGL
jgi:hypothetical protein